MSNAGLTLALALTAGVVAQTVAKSVRIPAIVLLLTVGAAMGPEGLAWIDPAALGEGLFAVVDFAVAIILFEGGLNLEWSRLKRQEAAIRRLITVGALVTLVGATLLALLVLGWRWQLSLLLGSLVVVTGPTVVGPLLRDLRLRPRLRTILEAEGVFIDPLGALMAAAALQIVVAPEVQTLAHEGGRVLASLAFGVLSGVAGGFLVAAAMRSRSVRTSGYDTIFALATVVLLFEACGAIVAESGLMAVTVAGVVVGNLKTSVSEELREFKDRLTVMLVGLLFVLLAADVSLNDVAQLGWPGVAVVLGLICLIRPLSVTMATAGLSLAANERIFIAAVAPRGIVAAAVATLTAANLGEQGIDGGDALKALVFLVIGATVVVSGLSAGPLSSLLSVRLPKRNRVAILGARGLALPLADRLRAADVPLVFIESDPKRSRMAEEAGHAVIFGDPLESRTLQRARPELVGQAIGATFSEHFNSLFVRQAVESFDVPHGLVAVEYLLGEQTPSLLPPEHADVLFEGAHDYERWDVRWRHGQVDITICEYRSPLLTEDSSEGDELGGSIDGSDATGTNSAWRRGLFAILTVERDQHTVPMHVGIPVAAGDRAAVAVHTPDRDDALRLLATRGWYPVAAEKDSSPAQGA